MLNTTSTDDLTAPSIDAQTLAGVLGLPCFGQGQTVIQRLASLEHAQTGDVTFLSQSRLAAQLKTTQASVVLIRPEMDAVAQANPAIAARWHSNDPYWSYALLSQWWAQREQALRRAYHASLPAQTLPATAQIHPSAVIDPSAIIGSHCVIGPQCCIEADVVLDEGVQLGPHCVVQSGVRIGRDSRLAARVVVAYNCVLGARVVIQPGAVIGGDGFGFAQHDGRWVKIEQLGRVRLGDDVEVGANTCIDRGALSDTVIEEGVKLDNLVQIAHNVHIGAHAAMAGCVGVAGSAKIGAGCTVGGAGMVLGHLELAAGVHISAASLVTRSIHQPGVYTGAFPIDTHAQWEKNAATLRRLHRLRDEVKQVRTDKSPKRSDPAEGEQN